MEMRELSLIKSPSDHEVRGRVEEKKPTSESRSPSDREYEHCRVSLMFHNTAWHVKSCRLILIKLGYYITS